MAEAHESLSGGASIDYDIGIISSWALWWRVWPSAITKLLPHASEVTLLVSKCDMS